MTVSGQSHPLTEFFGPFAGSEHMRADDKLAHETFDMTTLAGPNKRLETIMDFLVHDEDEFYTSKLLPWELTDSTTVVFDVFKFDRSIADVVPSQVRCSTKLHCIVSCILLTYPFLLR